MTRYYVTETRNGIAAPLRPYVSEEKAVAAAKRINAYSGNYTAALVYVGPSTYRTIAEFSACQGVRS